MNDYSHSSQSSGPASSRPLPAKQARSRQTRDRLLKAGSRLIASTTLENLTVAQIAEAAECSVGAFYQRFEDKEAFFAALVVDMTEEVRAGLMEIYRDNSGDRLIEALVENGVKNFRRRAGLLRAAARKGMEAGAAWQPIRDHGYFAADLFLERLAKESGRPPSASKALRVRFAFQVLHGTLINTLINDPGPVKLNDALFVNELTRAFRLVLDTAR